MTVKQWIALGIGVAAVVTEVVLICTNPAAAIFAGAGFVLGGVCGYLAKKKNIVNTTEDEQ